MYASSFWIQLLNQWHLTANTNLYCRQITSNIPYILIVWMNRNEYCDVNGKFNHFSFTVEFQIIFSSRKKRWQRNVKSVDAIFQFLFLSIHVQQKMQMKNALSLETNLNKMAALNSHHHSPLSSFSMKFDKVQINNKDRFLLFWTRTINIRLVHQWNPMILYIIPFRWADVTFVFIIDLCRLFRWKVFECYRYT